MKTPKNIVYLTILYAHKIYPKRDWFTGRELWDLQGEAQDYYNLQLPDDIEDQLIVIKKKHGYTNKKWTEVLYASQSFYFIPSAEMDACNKDIKAVLIKYPLINRQAHCHNYWYSLLKNEITKRIGKYMRRQKNNNGIFEYQLIS